MRRLMAALLLAGLLVGLTAALPQMALADAYVPGTPPVPTPVPAITVLSPTVGQSVHWYGEFPVSWTRVPDTIFYYVQVFLPPGGEIEFVQFRYVADTSRDTIRREPMMKVEAGLLQIGANHNVVVTAYGASDALIAQYGNQDPLTKLWPYIPPYLPLDQYRVLAQSAPLTFYVDP